MKKRMWICAPAIFASKTIIIWEKSIWFIASTLHSPYIRHETIKHLGRSTLKLKTNKDVKLYLWLIIYKTNLWLKKSPRSKRKSNNRGRPPRVASDWRQRSKFLINRLQMRAAFQKTNTLWCLEVKKNGHRQDWNGFTSFCLLETSK